MKVSGFFQYSAAAFGEKMPQHLSYAPVLIAEPANSVLLSMTPTSMRLVIAISIFGLLLCGCGQQDAAKTRQEAAQATEKVKQESKVAAVEIKKGAKEAAEQTKAAVQGVRDGLNSPDKPVNINSASKVELQTLPGVDEETADRIIKGRPYHTRDEVGTKGVVSPEEFNLIKDRIAVK